MLLLLLLLLQSVGFVYYATPGVCVCVCVQVDDDLTDKNTPSDSRVKDSYMHKKRKKERKKK